jgi:exonuclease SbcD
MKILHTADWHLGKKLHKYDLTEEHQLFFDWLVSLIQEREITLLLISGDVFDLANPPTEARALYFNFLRKMIELKCKIIITGGNHDSASMLNAPKDILALLDVRVIGGATPNLADELLVYDDLVVCAVPYLRDADLRQSLEGETASNRVEAVRQGIKSHYDELAQLCQEQYPDKFALAMGHLYAHGASTSESEREIQMGNLAGFEGTDFSSTFQYVALGHIHRPQRVSGLEHIRYSGSPIALSFSEKDDAKTVIELTLEHNQLQEITPIAVPKFRVLKKLTGSLEKVKSQLTSFQNEAPLKAFLEIEVSEEAYNPLLIRELNEIVSIFEDENATVLKHRITFKNEVNSTDELFHEGQQIDDISEIDILKRRLDKEDGLSDEHRALVLEAFTELLQKVKEEN